jgi:CRP-like cAMP-binding protein
VATRVRAPKGEHFTAGTLLARLRAEQQAGLLRLGRAQHFEDGASLLVEGEASDHVFLISKGWVKVVASMGHDREALLAVRVAGDLVGELGAFDAQRRIATVRAAGECRARQIEGQDFRVHLARHPDVALAVNASVGGKLRAATRRRVEFSTCTTKVRTARILGELADRYGQPRDSGTEITVPLSQAELAALAGTTEATIQRIVAELRQLGVIETGYRRMVVLKGGLLAALSEPAG